MKGFLSVILFLIISVFSQYQLVYGNDEISYEKANENVKFLLFTKSSRDKSIILDTNNPKTIQESGLSSGNPTRILVHGIFGNGNDDFNTLLRKAYLKKGQFNVIIMDWGQLSRIDFAPNLHKEDYIIHLGTVLKEFIVTLRKDFGVRLDQTYIIGHALGAHIAGYAGRLLFHGLHEKVDTIFALDPSGRKFMPSNTEYWIHPTDAIYVESIQTNGFNFGTLQDVGKASIYPNWGTSQPGCIRKAKCSHSRSYQYFAESLSQKFVLKKCEFVKQLYIHDCTRRTIDNGLYYLAGEPSQHKNAGGYFLHTNPESPFSVKPISITEHLELTGYTPSRTENGWPMKFGDSPAIYKNMQFDLSLPMWIYICRDRTDQSKCKTSIQTIIKENSVNLIHVNWHLLQPFYQKLAFDDDIGLVITQFIKSLEKNLGLNPNEIRITGAFQGYEMAEFAKNFHSLN